MATSWTSAFRIFVAALLFSAKGGLGASFTFMNKCDYTVWPGLLANAGSPPLENTGFELLPGSSRSFLAANGWSGRFWGRTGCNFDSSGSGSCLTGDCGSGQIECNGLGAAPPATLAEFTLGAGVGQDFYDVSLVDGYNLPMLVEGAAPSGACATTGCPADLNRQCPGELKTAAGGACRSACDAFGSPEYCCSGAFNTPATCKPSVYSSMFKSACPRSYSYAYDDATSTFTCLSADYTVTFCPSSTSQSSATYETPLPTGVSSSTGGDESSGSGYGLPYSDPRYGTGSKSTAPGDYLLADGSWLAGLAMGDSLRTAAPIWFSCLLTAAVAYVITTRDL